MIGGKASRRAIMKIKDYENDGKKYGEIGYKFSVLVGREIAYPCTVKANR